MHKLRQAVIWNIKDKVASYAAYMICHKFANMHRYARCADYAMVTKDEGHVGTKEKKKKEKKKTPNAVLA